MKNTQSSSRRGFLIRGMLGTSLLAAAPTWVLGAVTKAGRDPFAGLKVGIASYTLRKFTLDQAIAMTVEAGVKHICLKDVHLPFKTTREERQEAKRKIESAGLELLGGGVIYMKNDEAGIRSFFEYARDAGMPTVVCSPEPSALGTVEAVARDYDVRVAIHNHGPGDRSYPSPLDVMRLIADRDARLGVCIDVGHTVRLGQDPLAVIRECAPRLYDFHIKDVTEAAPRGKGTEVGRGVIDIAAVLETLLAVKFSGHLALEYEENPDHPMPGIIESFAYIRGVLAARR